ncbi:unnamed protein product [Heligmosomoides polygyrus]|uniref:OrfB_Zn_ribbon domain-containing protein n=1 Tax=Heligmosomoides polygyrus TaxID=6339 RepID=A0A183FU15_HELPZ|nr:unnamed protein product [Heligmosomoides polygyrus]
MSRFTGGWREWCQSGQESCNSNAFNDTVTEHLATRAECNACGRRNRFDRPSPLAVLAFPLSSDTPPQFHTGFLLSVYLQSKVCGQRRPPSALLLDAFIDQIACPSMMPAWNSDE